MIYSRVLAMWGRLAGRPRLRRLNNLLINLGARGLGVGSADARTNGELRYVREWLGNVDSSTSPVVIDVGANKGDFVEMILACCPTAKVHAFEPHPKSFERLRSRHQQRGVRCYNAAVGAKSEVRQLWDYRNVSEGSTHATFYPEVLKVPAAAELVAQEVTVRALDDFVAAESIESVALLKLDVEGHELACLDGAARLLNRGLAERIQFEFNSMHLDARVNMADFARRMSGYEMFRILPCGLLPLDLRDTMLANLYRMQNILAIRRVPLGGP